MSSENIIELINNNYIIDVYTDEYEINVENLITLDYNCANNKPQINSVELVGNLNPADLELATIQELNTKENLSNKVNSIDTNSNDSQYPSAKCVYDKLNEKLNLDLSNLNETGNSILENKANADLSNLNETGNSILENKANIDLSNLSEIGLTQFTNTSANNLNGAGKEYLSSISFPGKSQTNLTVGANATTYTAPANGWFRFQKKSGGFEYISLTNKTSGFGTSNAVSTAGWLLDTMLPCKKNDIIQINYNATGSETFLKFFYAEGVI